MTTVVQEKDRAAFSFNGMPPVDVILIHYQRPWTASILQSLKDQPCRTILVDASSAGGKAAAEDLSALADVYLTTNVNLGGWNRMLALWALEAPYCLMLDDDLSPGQNVIKHYLQFAEKLPDFAVLGQFGRNYPDGKVGKMQMINARPSIQEVDNVVRAYFMKTSSVRYLANLRHYVEHIRGCDLLFSCGLKMALGLKSYLLPCGGNGTSLETQLHADQTGLCSHKEHSQQRQHLLDKLIAEGWKPLI